MTPIALLRTRHGAVWSLRCFCCAMLFVLASHSTTWAGPQRRGVLVGVGVHLWNASRPQVDEQLELAVKAGFSIIRWDVPWKAVETSRGILRIPPNWDYVVDSANRKGITSLLILDYGNQSYDNGDKPLSKDAVEGFVRYARYLVEHFRGRVHYVEIWNEWDGNTGATTPGSPEDYIRLLSAVYSALKQVDPDLIVLGGGSSSITYSSLLGVHVGYSAAREGFFKSLLHLGLLDHVDGVSVHPYVYSLPGCMGTDVGIYEALLRIRKIVLQTKPSQPTPIFVTEVGWPIGIWKNNTITDGDQARYLARAIQSADSVPTVSAIVLYQLKDAKIDPADKEANFGLMRADGSLKASYKSTSDVVTKIENGKSPRIERIECAQ